MIWYLWVEGLPKDIPINNLAVYLSEELFLSDAPRKIFKRFVSEEFRVISSTFFLTMLTANRPKQKRKKDKEDRNASWDEKFVFKILKTYRLTSKED